MITVHTTGIGRFCFDTGHTFTAHDDGDLTIDNAEADITVAVFARGTWLAVVSDLTGADQ